MVNPVAQIREINDHGHVYQALAFICPGCTDDSRDDEGYKGDLHMLPVSGDVPEGRPRWDWDGNLEAPTLNPSIMTHTHHGGVEQVCHSFLRAGVFDFLGDCTHQYAGQHVPMPPLPDFMMEE